MSLIIVIFFCIAFLALVVYLKHMINVRSEYNTLLDQANQPRVAVEMPRYVGRDAKDVFAQINIEYPEYRIEIIGLDYINSVSSTNYDPKRIRLYITRSSKIVKVTVG